MQTTVATDADVLARIETFCNAHSIKPTTFGRLAIGDGNLVANLKGGRSLTLKNANKLLDFMASYTPDAAKSEAA